jgi:glutamate synthase (NADPH/NADH) small chain
MGKATGFLEYRRKENTDRRPAERIRDFDWFHIPLNEEERKKQGARCMNCGVPYCQTAMVLHGMVSGCPLHNLIPEWNDQIYNGHFHHALSRLCKTNNFPEFTGRVCPALCEKACTNGEYGDPVTIRDNELFLIETAFADGTIQPHVPSVRSGKKAAVIGSGPSGLAVADQLNHRGHLVTVYEREDEPGGLLMYGIPNMKLDKEVVRRRIKLMEAEGVKFVCHTDVGRDKKVTPAYLLKNYDAVILACGSKKPRPLAAADPAKVKGVYYAVDFLTATTKALMKAENHTAAALKKQGGYITAEGKNVVIIGGGDTGNDCIGTCIREGCASVTALEMMKEAPHERTADNPWPEWPKVAKTDYGHEEAIAVFGHDPRIYETTVKSVETDEKGNLKAVTTVKVKFENRKMVEVPGSEKKLPCELLLIAAGFIGCEDYISDAFGLQRSPRGTITLGAEEYAAGREKVFVAGDMHRGQSLVVWAITEGRACAAEADRYLMGYTGLE